MKKSIYKSLTIGLIAATSFTSCKKDLDRVPNNAATADNVYSTPAGYKQALAKVYGAYALTGNTGSGSSDLGGIDAGTSDFIRLWWNAQELPTEEAVCIWNDPGVQDFHNMNWTSANVILTGLYNRSIFQITVANAYIRESTDDKLSSRGITGADLENVKHYRAEARFLRAFQYWVLMDNFGNPPFVDENSEIGKTFPKQISRANLFNYIESELKAIDGQLAAPKTNEYGRADQAAAWALLARMYLNAGVYLGGTNTHLNDAITYASKVIAAGYTLNTSYKKLFMGDNNVNNPETILSINYDGVNTQNYGGTTYIINAAINADMNPASFGVPSGGWGGNHVTKNLPLQFPDYSGNTDKRAMFYGTKIEMDDPNTFTDGLKVTKFSNLNSDGTTPSSIGGTYASTDFPLFRLAEMYLIYAEATLRGGNGTTALATQYMNALRTRAYGNTSGNYTGTPTVNDVLNERARELYWEGFKRTDLIRYGMFYGDNYLWPWKGGVKAGRAVESYRVLYPLPATDVTANPNLKQNQGY